MTSARIFLLKFLLLHLSSRAGRTKSLFDNFVETCQLYAEPGQSYLTLSVLLVVVQGKPSQVWTVCVSCSRPDILDSSSVVEHSSLLENSCSWTRQHHAWLVWASQHYYHQPCLSFIPASVRSQLNEKLTLQTTILTDQSTQEVSVFLVLKC